jgi:hypothetical protein
LGIVVADAHIEKVYTPVTKACQLYAAESSAQPLKVLEKVNAIAGRDI